MPLDVATFWFRYSHDQVSKWFANFLSLVSSISLLMTHAHDNGDVSEEHEIRLGNWHHSKVASYTWWLPKKTLKEIFPGNFCFYTMKSSQFPSFCLLIAVLEFTFCQFLDKNCLEIFSNVVFLLVTMCGYPAMMPISQMDFMILTDISNVMCFS